MLKFAHLIAFLIYLTILSCSKPSEGDICINTFIPICNPVNDRADNYIKGLYRDQPLCLYEGDEGITISARPYKSYRTKPGQPLDSSAQVLGIGYSFFATLSKFLSSNLIDISLLTPVYPKDSSFEYVIDQIGEDLNKETLPIDKGVNSYDSQYNLLFNFDCIKEHDGPYQVPTTGTVGFLTIDDASDQYGRWIKVKKFNKTKDGNFIHYKILFDINVNLYHQNEAIGRFKGLYQTSFAIEQ